MTEHANVVHQDGDVIDAPLNKLKKSPRNARRVAASGLLLRQFGPCADEACGPSCVEISATPEGEVPVARRTPHLRDRPMPPLWPDRAEGFGPFRPH